MKINFKNKKLSMFITATLLSVVAYAQDSGSATSGFNISTNTFLLTLAFILLGVILMLASVVSKAVDLFKNNKIKNTTTLLLLVLFTNSVNAQEATAATSGTSLVLIENAYTLVLSVLIIIELLIIGYLIKQLKFLTGLEQMIAEEKKAKKEATLWEKINSFKSLEEEASLDTGHSYDGIRELDNVAPPWFTIGFVLSILFGIAYMYRYHISESAPLQIEEYELSVQKAKAEKEAYEKLMPQKSVDENNLVLLGRADIEKGRELYIKNCATCHANDGGGGAGPNLTDDFWLHGGSLKNIFVSIRDGYPDKAMPNWSGLLNPVQIEQLTSFVKSLKGTKPAAPKEKQGELYTEEVVVAETQEAPTDSSSTTK